MTSGRIRSMGGWSLALAGSLLLNLALFALMPGLIQQVPGLPDSREQIRQIQVIRVQKQETPPRKKKTEPPRKPKPLEQAARPVARQPAPKPLTVRPTLNFELNARLPRASMDIRVPKLEAAPMEMPVLKSQYRVTELDVPLRPIRKHPPLYPMRAKSRGIQGFVSVEFRINKTGFVEDIRILESKPKGVFDKSVLACVAKWQFKPGTVEGVAVATLVSTTIRFKLEQ